MEQPSRLMSTVVRSSDMTTEQKPNVRAAASVADGVPRFPCGFRLSRSGRAVAENIGDTCCAETLVRGGVLALMVVKFMNSHGQPVKMDGKPGSKADTHFELNPDGTFRPCLTS
ncbi:hypothetical protein [Nocardia thailandica]